MKGVKKGRWLGENGVEKMELGGCDLCGSGVSRKDGSGCIEGVGYVGLNVEVVRVWFKEGERVSKRGIGVR